MLYVCYLMMKFNHRLVLQARLRAGDKAPPQRIRVRTAVKVSLAYQTLFLFVWGGKEKGLVNLVHHCRWPVAIYLDPRTTFA